MSDWGDLREEVLSAPDVAEEYERIQILDRLAWLVANPDVREIIVNVDEAHALLSREA
jgi:Ribonuclease G/E